MSRYDQTLYQCDRCGERSTRDHGMTPRNWQRVERFRLSGEGYGPAKELCSTCSSSLCDWLNYGYEYEIVKREVSAVPDVEAK